MNTSQNENLRRKNSQKNGEEKSLKHSEQQLAAAGCPRTSHGQLVSSEQQVFRQATSAADSVVLFQFGCVERLSCGEII